MSETKNPDYAKGKIVVGSMGWSSYSVVDPSLTQVCVNGIMIMMIMNMMMMMMIDLVQFYYSRPLINTI